MNSLHDLGGMHGFGPVWKTPEGVAFHSDAEQRVFRLMMGLMAGGWCDTDGFRADVESLPLQVYARECFPANYLAGMEKQLERRGLLMPGDLEAWMAGIKLGPRATVPPAIMGERQEVPLPSLFRTGDIVRIRSINPEGHTRLPRYLRGQVGTITAQRGIFDFPDALAARTGRRPQPVYTVEFRATDVWGPEAAANDRLSAEMFQDYIESRVDG
ncbi:MAG: nthB [Rhodospirillales bacterium]|nr:nthB [Rhodospirillales bacterium]